MSMLPEAKLDVLLAHHASLEAQLLGQVSSDKYVQITRELAELNPLIDAVKAYRAIVTELADTEALIADSATDSEMRGMAEAERETLAARRTELEQGIRVALLPKDAMDDRNVVLEIRAGTGGDEAALFAGDLFRMYERFANLQGWKVDVISASDGTMGGYKEIIAGAGPRRVCETEIRIRRAPGAARARYRDPGAHPYLGCDRCGAARGRGCRCRDQERGSADRDHARARRRRPARQQDRIGDPHHPSADRFRRRDAGGALPAP